MENAWQKLAFCGWTCFVGGCVLLVDVICLDTGFFFAHSFQRAYFSLSGVNADCGIWDT